jgi:hypothetical protein
MSKPTNNGAAQQGPPFAVIETGVSVLPRTGVIELLGKNALLQSKENLLLGPLFHRVQDAFREWSKDAEPGCAFQAPEARLLIIRLSAFVPIATCLSDAARQQAEAAAEPVPNDRLKIALE